MPTAVAVGDFNRDGHQDFVVSNGLDDNLWIYFGHGDGTFDTPQVIPLTAGVSPIGLVAADLRGNGILDLVVANYDSQSVSVFLGNGNGTFSHEYAYFMPFSPACLTVADVNHDGKQDVVIAVDGNTVLSPSPVQLAIFFGDGSGTFVAPPRHELLRGVDDLPWNIIAADMNGDGFMDLISTGPYVPEGARLMLNDGNGNFRDAEDVYRNILVPADDTTQPAFTTVGDLNGDSCLDTATADMTFSTVIVRMGDCHGHFTDPIRYEMGDTPDAVVLADVNGDGHLDLVTVATAGFQGGSGYGDVEGGNLLSVALNDGFGSFLPAKLYRGNGVAFPLATADFNEDGKPDFVSASSPNDTVTIYINDGAGGFGDPQGISLGTTVFSFTSPAIADLNGDNKPDIFFLGEDTSQLYTFASSLNDGSGHFAPAIISPSGLSVPLQFLADYRLADFRNTGRQDFVGIALNNPFIAFAPSLGNGRFGPATVFNIANATGQFTIGDFNRDGFLDIATQKQVFLGDGTGSFRPGAMTGYSDEIDIAYIYATDVNKDGKLDLIMHSDENGGFTSRDKVWEFLGNGDGTFQPPRFLFGQVNYFTMTDLNHDGLSDMLFYPALLTFNPWPGDPQFSVSLGQPDGGFPSATILPDQYSGVAAETLTGLQKGPIDHYSKALDLDGDGNLDLLAVQRTAQFSQRYYAQVLAGNSDGTFTPTYDIVDFYKFVWPKFAADFDGDGKTDLLQWSHFHSSFHILKGGRASALQLELEGHPYSGTTGTGTVYLNTPSTGQTITLSSSNPGIAMPAGLFIPPGQLAQDFTFSILPAFDPRSTFDVRATLGTDTAIDYGSARVNTSAYSLSTIGATEQTIIKTRSSTPVTLKLTSLNGHSSTMTFSCILLPQYVGTCNFSPAAVVVPPNGSATTSFVLQTGTNVAVWDGTIQIIAQDGINAKMQPFTLHIPFIDPPEVRVSADSLSFQSMVGRPSVASTVTLSTFSGTPHISKIETDLADFTQTNNCPYTLNVVASCVINISFKPGRAGARNGNLIITDDALNNPQRIALMGTGVDFMLTSARPQRPGRSGAASSSGTSPAKFSFLLRSTGPVKSDAVTAKTGSMVATLQCANVPKGEICVVQPSMVDLNQPETPVQVTISKYDPRSQRLRRSAKVTWGGAKLVATSGDTQHSIGLPDTSD